MSFYVNNKYRIKRADNQQDMMQKLLSGNRIFNAYRDILVLSAIVGYCNKAYKPVEHTGTSLFYLLLLDIVIKHINLLRNQPVMGF